MERQGGQGDAIILMKVFDTAVSLKTQGCKLIINFPPLGNLNEVISCSLILMDVALD